LVGVLTGARRLLQLQRNY